MPKTEHAPPAAAPAAPNTDLDRCLGLFEAEFDYIFQSLRRQGLSEADAEDVVQDVFLIMWRRWADYDARRPLRAWLAGMAFRVAYRQRGKAGRELPGGLFEVAADQPSPEEHAFESSERALVWRVLACLSERERLVVRAHDVEGVSMHHIADTLQIPLQTAYTRLRSGRRNFARLLRRMATVTDARADLNLRLLRPDHEVAKAPVDRRRRAISRVRALLPLLPGPLQPTTLPLARSAARPSSWIEGLSLMVVAIVSITLAVRPSSPPAARGATATVALAGAADQQATKPAVRRPARGPLGRAPTFLSVTPTLAPQQPDAGAPGIEAGALHDGLLGYWRFDDGPGNAVARDLSGHGNDCLLRGLDQPSTAHWTSGPLGGALALPGRAWLECPRTDPLAGLSNELTVALWVKRTGQESHVRALVSRQFAQDGRDHFHLGFRDDKLWLRTSVKGTAAGSRSKLQRGRWYHVAGTVETDGTARVFIDGEEVGSKRAGGRPGLGGGKNPLMIGAGFNRADSFISERLRGVIDELVIYERALAPEEIRALARDNQPPLITPRMSEAGALD